MNVGSKYKRLTFGLVLTIAAILALILVRFSQHVLWLLDNRRPMLQSISAVPVSVTPRLPVPESWILQRYGSLQLRLPAGSQSKSHEGHPESVLIAVGTKTVGILPSGNYENLRTILDIGRRLIPSGKRGDYSDAMLVADVYGVSSTDFSWRMSKREVERYKWMMTNAPLLRLPDVASVELVNGDNVDGLLLITPSSAIFEWYAPNATTQGSIVFEENQGTLQLDWVRAVCQTVSFLPATDRLK
jgi:hypothetical protein